MMATMSNAEEEMGSVGSQNRKSPSVHEIVQKGCLLAQEVCMKAAHFTLLRCVFAELLSRN